MEWRLFISNINRYYIVIYTWYYFTNFVKLIKKNGKFVVKSSESEEKIETFAYVVNCTWQNVEYLNAKFGIGDRHSRKHDPKTATTLRLKLLAEVSLPRY